MLFNSLEFLIFFPIVVLIYYLMPKKVKNICLLVASYYFYMCWNAKYVLLLFLSTVVTFLSGLLIEQARNSSRCKAYINIIATSSFVINLGLLCYFKYAYFFVDILRGFLYIFKVQMNEPVFDILLPVGISFYTFQALGYTIDVCRGNIKAEKNFIKYALFVSFFPQLVAGPIERSKNLLEQLTVPSKLNFDNLREGILLMIWGYFLKIVLADRISVFVDTVYGDYNTYSGYFLIVATFLFAFQIYCDFYGYSNIAMGAARILGIKLMDNFNAPYFSETVSSFWRNWHISLTSWFKDYLYIPMGGNKKGRIRKYLNIMTVFLVSGLWHGASFSFVIWGGLNGIYQIAGELLLPIKCKLEKILKINNQSIGYKIISIITTFLLVDFSWIFFRAGSIQEANSIICKMISLDNIWILFDGSLYDCGLDRKNFGLMMISIIILICVDYLKKKGLKLRIIIMNQDYFVRLFCFIVGLLFIMIFGKWGPSFDNASFIYFQF